MHDARRGPRSANITNRPQHPMRPSDISDGLFDPEAILQREYHGFRPEQRRQQIFKLRISRRLDRHDHQITGPNLRGRTIDLHLAHMNPLRRQLDPDSSSHHRRPPTAHQEMNIEARLDEQRSIITTEGAGTDNRDAEFSGKRCAHKAEYS